MSNSAPENSKKNFRKLTIPIMQNSSVNVPILLHEHVSRSALLNDPIV